MKKLITLAIGLALGGSALMGMAQEVPKDTAGQCPQYYWCKGKGNGNCLQFRGAGQGQGQQNRSGWGQGRRGFRCGPQDGTGPRRDGSCGRCPALS